jgi:hypothetical protein
VTPVGHCYSKDEARSTYRAQDFGFSGFVVNTLAPELNPSAQRCLPRFLLGILIFKGLTARRFYKSFGVKGLTQ